MKTLDNVICVRLIITFVTSSLVRTATSMSSASTSSWEKARKLSPPIPESTVFGEDEGGQWWLDHETLLQEAWNEWSIHVASTLPSLNASHIVDPMLRNLVHETWLDPSVDNEKKVRSAWDNVVTPGHVYQFDRFFTPYGLEAIRSHLDAIIESGIPIRRPNGMNRYGTLLDPEVPGGVGSSTAIMSFLNELVRDYIRPMGRLFFPSYVGRDDDVRLYAFSIRYSANEDLDLKEHSDASVISFNVNLNLPNEQYDGSSIYFVNPETSEGKKPKHTDRDETHIRKLQFDSGTALLHRGMIRHGALPIANGTRQNLVIWLYGRDGSVRFAPYETHERLSLKERWREPSDEPDPAANWWTQTASLLEAGRTKGSSQLSRDSDEMHDIL